jgi:hypothetical protein
MLSAMAARPKVLQAARHVTTLSIRVSAWQPVPRIPLLVLTTSAMNVMKNARMAVLGQALRSVEPANTLL